jgi:dTMP kinase
LDQHNSGFVIAIEGIDQSGKRTQSKLLLTRLEEAGRLAALISFPDYSTVIGGEIKAFLAGRRSYNLHSRHMLLSLNRWERKDDLDRWMEEDRVVVVNRYSGSNYAYGVAQGLSLDWLMGLERGLPEPDLTILIDVQPETSLERKAIERDIHEQDQTLLKRVRLEYLKLAERFGWRVINGSRSTAAVQKDLWQAISNNLNQDAR